MSRETERKAEKIKKRSRGQEAAALMFPISGVEFERLKQRIIVVE
jgi:hypothetical protein